MKPLIEMKQEYAIVCDNPTCDYKVHNETGNVGADVSGFLNVPCPLCGQNLLTEKDLAIGQYMIRAINFINKYFSWLGVFSKKKPTTAILKIHDGIHIDTHQ